MEEDIFRLLKFRTFGEFCRRADEILRAFIFLVEHNRLNVNKYKKYIYEKHQFSDNQERDLLVKDKCWMWLMSYKYEPMEKNELYSVLGQLKKGR